jgi:hypothetical protein
VLSLTGEIVRGSSAARVPFERHRGVTTEEYDDGEFVGQQYTFEGVALGEFNSDPAGQTAFASRTRATPSSSTASWTCLRVSRD